MYLPVAFLPATQLIGIGLRPAHRAALRAMRPPLGFLGVHTGQMHDGGGIGLNELLEFRSHYLIGLHDDGVALGPAGSIDEGPLAKLAKLVEQIEPERVALHRPPLSGPFDEAALANWVDGIQHVQGRLGRTILLGKCLPSSPSSPDAAELAGPTPDFLAEVCRRSGCGLMLDLGHLLVAELNRVRREARQAGAPALDPAIALRQARARALDFIWSLPPPFVTQFLLAGFRWPIDPGQMLSDERSQRIAPALWDIYEQALAHAGECPTLIDWDVDLPPLAVLLDEARLAAEAITLARGGAGCAQDDPA